MLVTEALSRAGLCHKTQRSGAAPRQRHLGHTMQPRGPQFPNTGTLWSRVPHEACKDKMR